jgi:hypothetical protein
VSYFVDKFGAQNEAERVSAGDVIGYADALVEVAAVGVDGKAVDPRL